MKIQYIIGILVAFLFVSCSHEEEEQKPAYGKIDVAVSVTLPQPESVNALTRAGGLYTDTDIKNVDLLIFDKDAKFMERVKVENDRLVVTGTGINFTVRLDATSERRIIHLVANGRSADGSSDRLNFGDITPGMAENAAISSLQTASLEHVDEGESTLLNHVMPLVMWGRFALNGINIVTKAEGVKLLRSTACIQVKKSSGGVNTGLDDFVIEGITVHQGACHGFLAPTDCTGEVNTPVTANPVTGGTYLDYRKGWVNGAEPSLYIYERNCSASDYMGVVIAARYKGKKGYYKVVMNGNNGAPLNIVRNHRYIVTVVGVNGPGYENPDIAVASAPSNALKVELTDEDTDLPCIVADGEYRMASSNNVFSLYGKTGVTTSATGVDICTVYSSRGVQPVLTLPADCNWLTNLSAQALGSNKYKITGDFTSPANSAVSTTLTMTCDNLFQPVRVSWNPIISDQKDTDSFVFDLVGSTDRNWTVRVLNPTSAGWLFLHPSAASPGAFPGDGMVSELSSKYSSHAYLHVAFGANRRGTVLMTSASGGETVARKIVVIQ
ncbi:FimB/Mfa2 family fimbrial subunit [Bacteroides fragilis]|uniref:Fimbrillin-A associated anchor s Mfa1 and Mfa2 family protein n=1 Tax=Bacteroides fragilis TaxID=817 RepID=A0A396C3Y0_BACFG|nr:FimB/Mfa2 family fimbrial subunit [Bacteroides fragilis]MCM0229156.1 FimB/Mfa2 family fimbrial subunit [Bacteroides fragilis]RHH13758.1 hypothetical protein DW228_07690 [Bacteroides fragilis]